MSRRLARFAAPLGLVVICATSFLATPPAGAVSQSVAPVAQRALASPALPVAGNYCISCHDTADPRLAQAADWRGSIWIANPCPGLQAEDEALYLVEQQLLAISRLSRDPAELAPLYESYGELLDAPRDSVDAFAAQAQQVAYKGGKIYAALNREIEAGQRQRVLIVAALVSALLLSALGWGLRNTLRWQPAGPKRMWRPGVRMLGLLGLVALLFALPLFRTPDAAVVATTVEEQTVQAELDKSSRAGAAAERALARAWMLSQVAATWAQVDPARGATILDEALAAEARARADAEALWGRSEAGREAAIGSVAGRDKAALVAEELLSVRNRAWALRLIATEWAVVNPGKARAILLQAEAVARSNPTAYGQIDRAANAVAFARLGERSGAGESAANEVASQSAGLEAEVLRLYRAGEYPKAWDAAAGMTGEWDRARAQAAIAAAWGNADAATTILVPPLRDWALRRIEHPGGEAAQLPPDTDSALHQIDQFATEADKAAALRALAVATGDPAIFGRALTMAAAARVRGDALAPARASLALARDLIRAGGSSENVIKALAQAHDLAGQIAVKYK